MISIYRSFHITYLWFFINQSYLSSLPSLLMLRNSRRNWNVWRTQIRSVNGNHTEGKSKNDVIMLQWAIPLTLFFVPSNIGSHRFVNFKCDLLQATPNLLFINFQGIFLQSILQHLRDGLTELQKNQFWNQRLLEFLHLITSWFFRV